MIFLLNIFQQTFCIKKINNDDYSDEKYYLYCKKVNDKYYYLIDMDTIISKIKINYLDPNFAEQSKQFVDVTKSNFTKYEKDEYIINNMVTDEHYISNRNTRLYSIIKKERLDKRNFFEKYAPNCKLNPLIITIDNQWIEKTMGEIPSEYVPIGKLQNCLGSPHYYDLYVKKINDKYYYLIGDMKEQNSYC